MCTLKSQKEKKAHDKLPKNENAAAKLGVPEAIDGLVDSNNTEPSWLLLMKTE